MGIDMLLFKVLKTKLVELFSHMDYQIIHENLQKSCVEKLCLFNVSSLLAIFVSEASSADAIFYTVMKVDN